MSTIDDVIQRSRQPGGFSERKTFTVARQRAIRKMREFALADPHYYILELIQAAIANGASHVHIEVDDTTLGFSYVDGGFARQELAQLFDFLFASKEDFENADIRQLALGINALMIMEPSRVIVESGDGTLESTDRILIHRDNNTVEVGTPDRALRGTFVRVEGLDRSKIKGKSNLRPRDYGPRECAAIEERCLAAPIPLIVNDEPVFGYSAVRTPNLFGYRRVVTFDEGDLYGSIGVPEHRHKESFRLLTRGVWIESTEAAKIDNTKIGGVICYDRLNKTADHAGIVRDDRFEELWARIRPYARQVADGKAGDHTFAIETLEGETVEPRELRGFLRARESVVVVDELSLESDQNAQRAAAIGEALDSSVLRAPSDSLESLHVMAGDGTDVLEPDLNQPDDLDVYRQPPAEPPARPWLTGAVDVPEMQLDDLAEMLVAEESIPADIEPADLSDLLGRSGIVRATVYTPADDTVDELEVRVLTLERVVWEGTVTTPWSGHQMDVHLPAVAPNRVGQPREDTGEPLARQIAEVMARHGSDQLEQASDRALASLAAHDITPSGNGARLALASLSRRCLKRLRQTDGDHSPPRVHFSIVDPTPGPDLLEVDIFETNDGTRLSMRDLEDVMAHTGGLVYGTVPQVEPDLEDLNESRILKLDVESERHLLSIVGEAAYIRVDRRDVLAEEETDAGNIQVRDMAVGLRDYPDFPMLVEGSLPDRPGLETGRDARTTKSLVDQLIELWRDPSAEPDFRRQAVRHLQWFACRRLARHGGYHSDQPDERPSLYTVDTLPLFLDGRGRSCSLRQILAAFEEGRTVTMIDGQSADVCELGVTTRWVEDTDEGARINPDAPPVDTLMMNAWVARLIGALGPVRGAFDFDFHDDEAADVHTTPEEAYLTSKTVSGEGFEGRVGIPATPISDPSIALIDRDRGRTSQMHRPARTWGLTGFINFEGDIDTRTEALHHAVVEAGARLTERLADQLPDHDPGTPEFAERARALFDFAGRHLQMIRRPDGTISISVDHPLAQHILSMPVFPTTRGNPISAQRLVQEFALAQSSLPGARRPAASRLADAGPDGTPDVLREWLDRHLTPHAIVEPAGDGRRTGQTNGQTNGRQPDEPATTAGSAFNRRLERSLAELHPDDHLEKFNVDGDGPLMRVKLVGPNGKPAQRMGSGGAFRFVTGPPPTLWVHPRHPTVTPALENPGDDDAFAWVLLAAYAHLNELFEPVTNDHELEFQRRVANSFSK